MSQGNSLLRSAGQVAIGTLMSRVTGFIRTLALAALLGNTLVNDAYNVANTLPNQVFELLLGGVLTSVIVPLLVRAEKDAERRYADANEYPQRLFTLAVTGLTGATVLGVLASGLLVAMMGISFSSPIFSTATLMAILLLPQMIFYGIGALAGAVLNTRDSYRAPAWAPVVNNLVVIVVALGMIVLSRRGDDFTTLDVTILCVGTTLGIVVQALILIPALRRAGFEWKWRWGFRGMGLGELRSLAGWLVGYVLIGQVGFIVATNVANVASDDDPGQLTQWVYAALLFQLPYGILGVSLLTAIMPKMSRAAADADWPQVKRYLADGTRLTGLGLIPISVAFWILAVPLTVLFFDNLQFDGDAARSTGLILAAASFGLLPYAVTLLQLRVFFATKDAKTPTLLMVGIVGARIALSLLCLMLPTPYMVLGLAVANSLSFVAGAIAGDVVLRRRFGPLGTGRVVRDLVRMVLAAISGLLLAIPTYLLLQSLFGDDAWSLAGLTGVPLLAMSKWQIALILILSSGVGVAGFVCVAYLLGVPEVAQLADRLRGRLSPSTATSEYRESGSADRQPELSSPEAMGGYATGVIEWPGAPPLDLDAPVPIPPGGLSAAAGSTAAALPPRRMTAGHPRHMRTDDPGAPDADAPDAHASGDPAASAAPSHAAEPDVQDTNDLSEVTAPQHSAADADPNHDTEQAKDDQKPVASTRKFGKWALLGITCVGLVLALVIGWFTGLLAGKIFGPDDPNQASSSSSSSAPATATGSGDTPGQALQITAAELFDPPPGDGEENPDSISLSYDGQPGTTWPTLQYKNSANFGNIKPGVGIIYDLGADKTLSQVKIQTTIPGATVEIRTAAAESDSLDGYAVVANAELDTSTDIAVPEGTTARYVLVWITSLVEQQGGYFQASLSEVSFIS